MAERKHRCGGTLVGGTVQIIVKGQDGLTMVYYAHGLICDKCHEQLVSRNAAHHFQYLQTPMIVWNPNLVASTRLDASLFLTAGTAEAVN